MVSRSATIAKTLVLDRVLARTAETLETVGVPFLLLKGPAVADAFYDAAEYRPYGDIDLLVPAERFQVALHALVQMGWQRPQQDYRDSERALGGEDLVMRAGDAVVQLDLHRQFHSVRRVERVWEVFSRGSRLVQVGGRGVPAPSLPIQGLIAALHATTAEPGARSLEDLRRAAARLTDEQWREAAEAGRELDALGGLADGLRKIDEGPALLERLDLTRATDPELNSMTPALGWYLIRSQATRGAQLRMLAYKLFPSRARVRLLIQQSGEDISVPRYHLRRWTTLARALPAVVRSRRASRAARRTGG